jgi:hypothetical protein
MVQVVIRRTKSGPRNGWVAPNLAPNLAFIDRDQANLFVQTSFFVNRQIDKKNCLFHDFFVGDNLCQRDYLFEA